MSNGELGWASFSVGAIFSTPFLCLPPPRAPRPCWLSADFPARGLKYLWSKVLRVTCELMVDTGGQPVEDEIDDGGSTMMGDSANDIHEERYWLLIQILLACELLVRLDAITEGDELGVESIKPSEILRFEKDATKSVKWSLHLARTWLENIEVVKSEWAEPVHEEKHSGWLATLTKRMSLSREHGTSHHHHHRSPVYAMKGRHVQRQVNGLIHFAKQLRWPDVEYAATITEHCRSVTEGTPLNTPLASPSSSSQTGSHQSSYFGSSARSEANAKRKLSRRRKTSAALHPSGWLSKSYVSGLMLPGEGLCHFLMATLL
jgi:hypothetical protein